MFCMILLYSSKMFDELGTIIVVLSQMLLLLLGTLFNSILLVALRDLPDIFSSTYHVLLANICFANLISCSVLKPITTVFTGYAYAKGEEAIAFSFCQLYTFMYGTIKPILPWSLFALSWQQFLQERKEKTLNRDSESSGRLLSKKGLKNLMHFQEKKKSASESLIEVSISSKSSKTSRVRSGISPSQMMILVIIWIGALMMGLETYESQIVKGIERREVFVQSDQNSTGYTQWVYQSKRDMTLIFSKV